MMLRGNASFAIYSDSFAEILRKVRARVATAKKKRETGGFGCGGVKPVIPDRSRYWVIPIYNYKVIQLNRWYKLITVDDVCILLPFPKFSRISVDLFIG